MQQIRKLELWDSRGKYCITLQVSLRTKYKQFEVHRKSLMQQQAHGANTANVDRAAANLVDDIWTMDDKKRRESEHKHATVVRDDSRKFPVGMTEELLIRCSKDNNTFDKTSEDVLALVDLFRTWLVEDRCVVVPPVEFLLEEQHRDKPAGMHPRSSERAVKKLGIAHTHSKDDYHSPHPIRSDSAATGTTTHDMPQKRRRSAQESSAVSDSDFAKAQSCSDHRMSISRIAPPVFVEPEVKLSEASPAMFQTVENHSHETHFDSEQHFTSLDKDEDPAPPRDRKRTRQTQTDQASLKDIDRSDSVMRTPSRTSSWRNFEM